MIPEIKKIGDIEVLKPKIFTTQKGVQIYAIDAPSVDVVRISLVFKAGVKHQKSAYIASTCANMISEGCEGLSSQKIAERLDFYGIYYDVSVDRDYTIITVCCLGKFLDETLELLTKILTTPSFPYLEFDLYRTKRKSAIKLERERVDVKAREAFITAIYGKDHPYGTFAQPEQFDTLTLDEVKEFYNTFYCRKNLFVVMSGKIEDEDIDKISHTLDLIPEGVEAHRVEMATTPQPTKIYRPTEGAVQTALRIGRTLFDRSHPDFLPMQILTTLLGGYFSSRLMNSLREEHGYTYGAYAGVANLEESGYFAISTEVHGGVTKEAIGLIFEELETLRNEEVDMEELEMVKRVMLGEVLRILDGPFGIADVTIENIQNQCSNSFTEDMIEQINNVTPKMLIEMANKYLQPEMLTVVAVGVTENLENNE